MLTKRSFIHCLKHFQTKNVEDLRYCKENNMKDKCIVKKALFSIILFENPVPLNMRLLMQLRYATVEKNGRNFCNTPV